MPTIPEVVRLLYNKHQERGTRPSLKDISSALQSTARLHRKIFILIDALDECEGLDGVRAMLLNEIFRVQDNSSTNIFATSRFIPDIKEHFAKRNSSSLEIRAIDDDVRKYLSGPDSALPSFVCDKEDLRREVTEKIVRSVDGMFLLAQLHVKLIARKTSVQEVRDAILTLRAGSNPYDDAYEAITNRIKEQPKEHRGLAQNALAWIVFAKRELSPTELRHALAIKGDATKLNEDDLPEIDILVAACVGLITLDKDSNVVKLVHYTAQDYFSKDHSLLVPSVEDKLTEACATYLSFDQFERGIILSEESFKQLICSNPLYEYCTVFWARHAQEAQVEGPKTVKFLDSDMKVQSSARALAFHDPNYFKPLQGWTGLHLTAYLGLESSVKRLLDRSHTSLTHGRRRTRLLKYLDCSRWCHREYDDDDDDDHPLTPFMLACKGGHKQVVQLFFAAPNVDIHGEDGQARTPLLMAAEKGHWSVVEMFLRARRVNVDHEDHYGRTALRWAIWHRNAAVVKMLLDTGRVDVNREEGWGEGALSWAVVHGDAPVVKLLLDTGKVNVNKRCPDSPPPLRWAVQRGDAPTVKLLLDAGATDVDSSHDCRFHFEEYNKGGSLLWWAVLDDNAAIVKLLVDAGLTDVSPKDDESHSLLWWAALNNNPSIVEVLLDGGIFAVSKLAHAREVVGTDRGVEC